MKKTDVTMYSDYGYAHALPAVNVKHHLWIPDLIRKYAGKGNHDWSDDAGFWAWVEDRFDAQDYDVFDAPDSWAREGCWEMAQEDAEEVWPDRSVVVEQRGRSGGWCCVSGLKPVEDWDAIDLSRWSRFKKLATGIATEAYPYDFVFQLHGIWESVREERRNLYPAPANV